MPSPLLPSLSQKKAVLQLRGSDVVNSISVEERSSERGCAADLVKVTQFDLCRSIQETVYIPRPWLQGASGEREASIRARLLFSSEYAWLNLCMCV